MKGKVNCYNCGHSWNKSDSSKKDMYVCHMCGKGNVKMENGGWLDDLIPEAQNGIEGTMGGLTDKGFNYNGAWGGPSMQTGGSLPGSVGFSYARTNSPAPSNGPYAKKTKASAQNGNNIEQDNEWLTNWYKNRKIPNEQLQSIYKQDEPYYLERLQNIPKVNNVDSIDNDPRITGRYENDTNKLLMTPNAGDNVYLHELNHYANNFPSAMRTVHGNITKANVAPKEGVKGIYNDKYNYFSDPDEVHSRIQVLRKEAGFKPDQEVTPEILDKFMKNYKGGNDNINDLFNIADPSHLLEMLNYMAANKSNKNSNIAQNGREMQFYQNGLDWKPKTISKNGSWLSKYEDGGIIEDDLGQWAHPGEITRIPSNQITMQGVPYPVMGISDTGDTQMMYPGEDYEFDGESVTEYPMMEKAQKGKRIEPLYVDSKNDPRYKAYRDSLIAYNTGNSVLRNIENIVSKRNSNADYSDSFTDLIKNPYKKPEYATNRPGGNPKGLGIAFKKDSKKNNAGKELPSDLQIAEQLSRLDALKVLPFRNVTTAELPTSFVYKKPKQPVLVRKPITPTKQSIIEQPQVQQQSYSGPDELYAYGAPSLKLRMTPDEWKMIQGKYKGVMYPHSIESGNEYNPTAPYQSFLLENADKVRKDISEYRNKPKQKNGGQTNWLENYK